VKEIGQVPGCFPFLWESVSLRVTIHGHLIATDKVIASIPLPSHQLRYQHQREQQ